MKDAFNKIDEYLSFFQENILNVSEKSDVLSCVSSLILREQYAEAKEILIEILKSQKSCRLLELYGVACDGLGEHEEAIDVFTELIAVEPQNPDHFNNISLACAATGKQKEAVEFAIRATEIDSNPLYFNNLGLQLRNAGMIEDSINAFKIALKKQPDPCFMVNLATAYGDKLDYLSAIDYCETAISIKPELSGAHVNLAYYYHMVGRHKEAWAEYEHRIFHFKQIRDFLRKFDINKKWNGVDSLKDKKVLVVCEQGLGDVINFIRYVALLKQLGCYIIVFGPLQLASLCEKCEGVDEYICKELPQELNYDYYVLLLSLPYLLKCDEIPNKTYISVPKSDYKPNGFSVGICWRGSKLHPYDNLRSINSALFFELSQIPGIQLFSLQKDDTTAELQSIKALSYMDNVVDFRDTAMMMVNLNLIISVDTAVLHLAGAMGCETWALLPYRCDWRWGLESQKTEWYPSVTLYRQKKVGNWGDIFDKVKYDIERKMDRK